MAKACKITLELRPKIYRITSILALCDSFQSCRLHLLEEKTNAFDKDIIDVI